MTFVAEKQQVIADTGEMEVLCNCHLQLGRVTLVLSCVGAERGQAQSACVVGFANAYPVHVGVPAGIVETGW